MTRAERQRRRRLRQLWNMRCVEFKTLLSLQGREKELNAELKRVRRQIKHTRRKLGAYHKRSARLRDDGFDMDKFFAIAEQYADGAKWLEEVN